MSPFGEGGEYLAPVSYPIREILPDRYYLLTCRTQEQMFLLRPSLEVDKIIAEWLIRAQRRYGIVIYAFINMSSHWHLVCRSPGANVDQFVREFQGLLARFVNKHWKRSGTVFPRRYSLEPIQDDEKLIERIVYVLTNPAKANLVDSIDNWPGLSSAPESLHRQSRTFCIFARTAWHKAGRPDDKKPFQEFVRLEVAPPPGWEHLRPAECARRLRELVYAREEELRRERKAQGKKVLGVRRILQASPTDRSAHPKKSPRPLCHASTRELWDEYRAHYAQFLELYRIASKRYRDGETDVAFPPGSFPPWYRGAA
ncbi:MAG: transposase [Planctomycetes bacterium]|nr:transposase [Planctomycetota bacterium]